MENRIVRIFHRLPDVKLHCWCGFSGHGKVPIGNANFVVNLALNFVERTAIIAHCARESLLAITPDKAYDQVYDKEGQIAARPIMYSANFVVSLVGSFVGGRNKA